jgi:hypothetical protein
LAEIGRGGGAFDHSRRQDTARNHWRGKRAHPGATPWRRAKPQSDRPADRRPQSQYPADAHHPSRLSRARDPDPDLVLSRLIRRSQTSRQSESASNDEVETIFASRRQAVRLTVSLPAALYRGLVAYAEIIARKNGKTVEPAKLNAPMVEKFIASDRAFAKARQKRTFLKPRPHRPGRTGNACASAIDVATGESLQVKAGACGMRASR